MPSIRLGLLFAAVCLLAPSFAQAQATTANPEMTYRKKVDRNLITMRVRPGAPLPGKVVDLEFEVLKHLATPDPVYGERAPATKAMMVATVTSSEVSDFKPIAYQLHPMEAPGTYGMHLTVPRMGLYQIAVRQLEADVLPGERPYRADFTLGVGKETPKSTTSDFEDEANTVSRRKRKTLSAGDTPQITAQQRMAGIGEKWIDLVTAVERDPKSEESVRLAGEMAALAAEIGATPPAGADAQGYAALSAEFTKLVQEMAAATAAPTQVVPAAPVKAGTKPANKPDPATAERISALQRIEAIELGACNKCHVRYRFGLTNDVSQWPKFTPKSAR